MRKVLALTFLLLSGCATVWTKPGASGEDLADARLKCTAYARMLCGGQCGVLWLNKYSGDCMRERGWTAQ